MAQSVWSVRALRGRDDGSRDVPLLAVFWMQVCPGTSGVVNLLVLVGEA